MNSIRPRELYRLGGALADRVIERHAQRLRGRARCVTIDLDPTEDPTHGAQQLSFFNGHYDSWCYMPVMGFVSFDGEAEQYPTEPLPSPVVRLTTVRNTRL